MAMSEATTNTKAGATKRDRANPSKTWDINDVTYVYNNYEQMTVAEIAKNRKLATFQVNQIITGLRKRNIIGKKRRNTQSSVLDKFAEKYITE